MENAPTLLVAFMFITILTLGIAGVLAELAEDVRQWGSRHKDGLLLAWTLLLLFTHFDLFWHVEDITLVEDWNFALFSFAEFGPMVLLFATQIALGAANEEDTHEEAQKVLNRSRFFWVFGMVHLWAIIAGFVLGVGFTIGSALSAAIVALTLLLSTTSRRTPHVLGLAAIAILSLGKAALTNFS